MSHKPSHRILLQAFTRGDFTLRGLASSLKGKGLIIDHKTLGNYIYGNTLVKQKCYEVIAQTALKLGKERIAYLSLWKKENRIRLIQTTKNKFLEAQINKAIRKGITACAEPAVGIGYYDEKHIEPYIKASVLVELKKGDQSWDVFEIDHEGIVSFYYLYVKSPSKCDRYHVGKDMITILRKFNEYGRKLSVQPTAMLEIAARELEDSAEFDPAIFRDGANVLVNAEVLHLAQDAMKRAADNLNKRKFVESDAGNLKLYSSIFEGYKRSDSLPEMKERIMETVTTIMRRFS